MQKTNENLIKLVQEGDQNALNELVQSNMGLVKKIVLRFKDRGCEYDDLVQIGTIGMIKAIKSFDFSFNTVFSTYAVPLIIGEIRRHLRDDGLIKISRTIKKNGIDRVSTVIECVGKTATIQEAIKIAGNYSTVMMFGLTAPNDTITVKPFEIVTLRVTRKF